MVQTLMVMSIIANIIAIKIRDKKSVAYEFADSLGDLFLIIGLLVWAYQS